MSNLSNSRPANYAMLVMGCVMMGSVGIFANLIEDTHPLNVVFFRLAFSALGCALLVPFFGTWAQTAGFARNRPGLWLFSGASLVAVITTYLSATILFSVGLSIVLLYTAPAWLVLWMAIIPRRGLFAGLPRAGFDRTYMLLVAAAIAGLAVLVSGAASGGVLDTPNGRIGFTLAFASGPLFALSMVMLELMRVRGMPGEQMIISGSLLGTAVFLPAIFILPASLTWSNLAYAAPLGMFATALGGFFWFHSFEVLGPNDAPVLAYIEPLTGIILGIIVLSESFHWYMAIGAALILGSGIAQRARERRRNAP